MATSDLLLLHGTIYGHLGASLPWADFSAKSASLDKMADQTEWRSGLFPTELAAGALDGAMTDNAPIDVVSWSASGSIGETGLELWRQCMTVLMRHN